jgi:hypothetical protein
MKRALRRTLLFSVLLSIVAAFAFIQTEPPATKSPLAAFMPGGALLYLETQNFSSLVRDWDESQVKAAWLKSDNYSEFSHSNLYTKLGEVYGKYGEAAGFLPGLQGIMEIAGKESALALYDIHDVEFLYISRVGDAELMKSRLWTVRDKFQQRQAGGVSFYLRTDPVSKRTVAFAFAKGLLLLATRDDLVAHALELLAGGSGPNIASDRWHRDAIAAAGKPGELRMVLNLESLAKSVYFRSYWIQRNVSTIGRYWAGVVDESRSGENIAETRIFLRSPDAQPAPASGSATVSDLLPLVPPDASFYKAGAAGEAFAAAELIIEKLIGRHPQEMRSWWRDAPTEISIENRVGSEADLETHIDERPLPSGAAISDSLATVQAMVEKSVPRAVLLVQSSSTPDGFFVQMPAVIVLEGAENWDLDSVRNSLVTAVGGLWTTSQLGTRWISGTAGRHAVERLDGLGGLLLANRGKLLFLSNDAAPLAAVLDRAGTSPMASAFTYAAGFRHSRERSNYARIMKALDFNGDPEGLQMFRTNGPQFFSGNIASLSQVLSRVSEIHVTEEERATVTLQTVLYQVGQ